jgi:hypothetical protein
MVLSIAYIFLHPLNHDRSFKSFHDNQFLDFNEHSIKTLGALVIHSIDYLSQPFCVMMINGFHQLGHG